MKYLIGLLLIFFAFTVSSFETANANDVNIECIVFSVDESPPMAILSIDILNYLENSGIVESHSENIERRYSNEGKFNLNYNPILNNKISVQNQNGNSLDINSNTGIDFNTNVRYLIAWGLRS